VRITTHWQSLMYAKRSGGGIHSYQHTELYKNEAFVVVLCCLPACLLAAAHQHTETKLKLNDMAKHFFLVSLFFNCSLYFLISIFVPTAFCVCFDSLSSTRSFGP